MDTSHDFAEFIRRIRSGDETAAAELLHHYEQELRTFARVRLSDPRLRRVLDSMDVCQSILANFFARAVDGQFNLETPQDLMKLLTKMVENKVYDHARAQKRQKRDTQRLSPQSIDELDPAGSDETPSTIVSTRELLDKIRGRLTEDVLLISDLRRDGQTWDTIAATTGEPAEALRKRFARAINSVLAELGLPNSLGH